MTTLLTTRPPTVRPVAPEPHANATRAIRDYTEPAVFLMCLGLMLHALCAVLGRRGASQDTTDFVFWISLVLIFVPPAARVIDPRSSSRERLVLSVALPIVLMLSRLMLYPTRFVYHDELAHANTLRLIDETHHLFASNPLLPVSAYYPGVEIAAHGAQALTGLTAHAAAAVVLTLARVVMVLAIITVVERVSGSQRIACLASLVYVCNPQFLFFNSQYSYQSLALPLALLTVCAFLTRSPERRWRSLVGPAACFAGVVVSHHLTSMLLVAAFVVWFGVEFILRGRSARAGDLAVMAILGLAMVLAWTMQGANPATSYLEEIAHGSITDIGKLAAGQQTHEFFTDFGGDPTPHWQRAASIASILIIVGCLIPALLQARVWLRRRDSAAVVLCLLAVCYPIIPAGHLTFATSEVSDRSSGFLFLGVGFVLAWWLVEHDSMMLWRPTFFSRRSVGAHRRTRTPPVTQMVVLVTAVATVLFVGGIVSGSGPRWNRTPGPYLVSADPRSVDASNISAAEWLRENMPDESRTLADRVGRLLAGSIGQQYPITHVADRVNATSLLLGSKWTAFDRQMIKLARVDLVVVDERLSRGLPRVGVYYENGEFGSANRTGPVSRAALTKLARVDGVQRVYDNGSVVIYDVRPLR